MPVHLAVDANVVTGTAVLVNAKTAIVMYYSKVGQPVLFSAKPLVKFTLLDTTLNPPYLLNHLKTGNLFSGFKVAFAANVSISFDWEAIERGV